MPLVLQQCLFFFFVFFFQRQTHSEDSGQANPADKHSTVTEAGRQPAVVPQPGQEEGDRDTVTPDRRKAVTPDRRKAVTPGRKKAVTPGRKKAVTPDRRKAVTPGRKKAVTPRRGRETIDNPCYIPMSAQETGGTTPDNYRKARGVVRRVGHIGDGKKAASCSEGRKTTEGEYSNDPHFMLEPGQTAGNAAAHRRQSEADPDEYNALSFSRAGGATAMSEASTTCTIACALTWTATTAQCGSGKGTSSSTPTTIPLVTEAVKRIR